MCGQKSKVTRTTNENKAQLYYMFYGKNFQETNIYTKSDFLYVIITKEHCQFTFLS